MGRLQDGRLQDKVAFITGAASGIGFACAERFAREGAKIAGFDIAELSAEMKSTLKEIGNETESWSGDVRDEEALERSVAGAVDRFGRIDILINAAGVSTGGAVGDLETAEWDRVMDINLKGTFLASKYVVRGMAESVRAHPLGHASLSAGSIEGLVGLGDTLFRTGVNIALPVIGAIFALKLTIALLARVAQKLHLFVLAFTLTILMGQIVLAIAFPSIGAAVAEHLQRTADIVLWLATRDG